MRPPQFPGFRANLDQVLQDRVIAMPLHEIRPAHERAMFGGPAIVMPEVEVFELDRLLVRLCRSACRLFFRSSMMPLAARTFSLVDATTSSASL